MASTQESRETRADAKESIVHLTAGAKERVDHAKLSAQAVLGKIAHPFDKEARKKADEKAERKKAEVSKRLQEVRNRATQEAEQERVEVLADMGHPAEAVGAPPGLHDSQNLVPDPSRARPEEAAAAGVPPSGKPEVGSWTAGQSQGQGQAQDVRGEGLQSAYGSAGYGPGTGDVDTEGTAAAAAPVVPGSEGAPPPPNYHNPFH